MARAHQRLRGRAATIGRSPTGGPLEGAEIPGYTSAGPSEPVKVSDRVLAGFGWQRDDVKLCQQMASNGAEPIGSLGYDGPLAALSPERQNLADYFKETVAVVTNPAIDREREIEHFSTSAVFGRRPLVHAPAVEHEDDRDFLPGDFGRPPRPGSPLRLDLPQDRPRPQDLPARGPVGGVPRPRGGHRHRPAGGGDEPRRDRAHQAGGSEACARGRRAAGAHRPHRVRRRASLSRPSPGHLRRGSGVEASSRSARPDEENLRRRCSIVLRSAALRNVHDVVMALGSAPTASAPT